MTAEAFATAKHDGQFRKETDVPYVEHCRDVAQAAAIAGLDADAIAAAWLHDVVEDTDCDYDDLVDAGFNDRTVQLVRLLTKWWPETAAQDVKDAEKPKYYAGILSDEDAVTLKLLDRACNLRDLASLALTHKKWARNYLRKTVEEFGPLQAACRNGYAKVQYELRLGELKRVMSQMEHV